jgi:2TM domain-containing protein
VMTGLITLNTLLWVFTAGDFPWAVFPLVGWGVGLTFHYFDAYRREGRSIRARQGKVEAYAERMKELV